MKTFRQFLNEIKIPKEDAWPDFARRQMVKKDYKDNVIDRMSDEDVRKREDWHRKQYVVHAISGNQDKAKYHRDESNAAETEIKSRSNKFLLSLGKKA